jgi:hypothetical protein
LRECSLGSRLIIFAANTQTFVVKERDSLLGAR